jgi:protein regulator of cytokinesis 1
MHFVLDELQAQMEVSKFDTLKANRMKELVVKRRLKLEDICRCAHIKPDVNITQKKVHCHGGFM